MKLVKYSLTPDDVASAIQAQNAQVSSGELGGLPSAGDQQLNATIIGPSYLETPSQFGDILLKVQPSGAQVRLRDVAKIALGAEQYAQSATYNGAPAAAIALKLAAGANALDTVAAVRQTIAQLTPNFPPGVQIIYPYDTSSYVRLSVEEVVQTLFIAIMLVFFVMLLFLQNFRATLIPTIAVPVVLAGTCGILAIAGYSINDLTLFGMVLAIGLLVDDAIVVVENVERIMAEQNLTAKQAALISMSQISGALVGIALVLTAVLAPMAFFAGSIGVIYRQFSVTIVSAMILSVIVALTFTPALCATLLRPRDHARQPHGFFRGFNKLFERAQGFYVGRVGGMLRRRKDALAAFAVIVALVVGIYQLIPDGFLPDEDQGVLSVQVVGPPGATAIDIQATLDKIRTYFLTADKQSVQGVFAVSGFNYGGRGQSTGLVLVRLKDLKDRPSAANSVFAIQARAQRYFASINSAIVVAFAPPAVIELGNAIGFDFELIDKAHLGHAALMNARNHLLGMAMHDPILSAVRPNGLDDEPQ